MVCIPNFIGESHSFVFFFAFWILWHDAPTRVCIYSRYDSIYHRDSAEAFELHVCLHLETLLHEIDLGQGFNVTSHVWSPPARRHRLNIYFSIVGHLENPSDSWRTTNPSSEIVTNLIRRIHAATYTFNRITQIYYEMYASMQRRSPKFLFKKMSTKTSYKRII